MSLLDPRKKTISLKVVYYGPGLGGKTTSLKYIHRVIDPEGKVKLVSLDTDEDRTLFFDFLPIELGLVGRFKVKIQGFTVPGQVKYNMTRRYVLTGADGIVFVSDSDPARVVENVESLINLGDNLRAHGLNVNNIPLVFQYNKQDLPNAVSPVELEEKLNFRKVPGYPTIATEGRGVFEAFTAVSKLMVSRVIKTYNLKEEQADEERILKEVENRLRSLGQESAAPAPPPEPAGEPEIQAVPPGPARAEPPASPEPAGADATSQEAMEFFDSFSGDPAAKAGAGNGPSPVETRVQPPVPPPNSTPDVKKVALPSADRVRPPESSPRSPGAPPEPAPRPPSWMNEDSPASARSDADPVETGFGRDSRSGASRPTASASPSLRNVLRSLLEIGRNQASAGTIEKTATLILSVACQTFEARGGSLLMRDESGGKLRPLHLSGFRNDPLLAAHRDDGQKLLDRLESGGDQLLVSRDHNPDLYAPLHASHPSLDTAIAVPVEIKQRVQGALIVYLDETLDLAESKDGLKMLMVLAYQAAVGLLVHGAVDQPVGAS